MSVQETNPESIYKEDFYKTQAEGSYNSAMEFVPIVHNLFPFITSVADLGCGVGTTLKAWNNTVEDVILLGIDGNKVDEKFFYIHPDSLIQADLTDINTVKNLGRRFDLVESLEVAEHLDASEADNFIQNLTSLSDIVLFSAAAPFQGGTHHVNEQAPAYWNALFQKYDYVCFDIIRDKIWANGNISWWYCQNLMLFVKKEKAFLLEEQGYKSCDCPKLCYHPRCVQSRFEAHKRRRNHPLRKLGRQIDGAIRRIFKG